MQLVRGSELQDFLRCRLRWKYAWVDGYKPKQTAAALSFGILVHKWLEVFYNTGDVWAADEAMRELYFNSPEIQQNDELYTLSNKIVINYYNHYNDSALEVVATELTFMIPLDDEIAYTGTIDLIYKQDGKLYFMDHKTTTSIEKYTKNSDMDRQISRYWWALQQLADGNGYIWDKTLEQWFTSTGWKNRLQEPAGFVYNIIKKDVPEAPKVLQNGSLSKDKRQNTTYELYTRALMNMGIAGGDSEAEEQGYMEILDHLRDYPREYFKRVEVYRNQAEIDASIQEFYATANDMTEIRNKDENRQSRKIYRNITHECPNCPYFEPCKSSLDGSDTEHLLENLYVKESRDGRNNFDQR